MFLLHNQSADRYLKNVLLPAESGDPRVALAGAREGVVGGVAWYDRKGLSQHVPRHLWSRCLKF